MNEPGINKAIEKFGSPELLAKAIQEQYPNKTCYRQLVEAWRKSGRPTDHWVIPIEQVSGISRHELRPDIYPDEKKV